MKSYINKKEWLLISITWLVMILLSLLPFIFAIPWLKQGFVISGIHSLAHGDVNVYLSYLKQVQDGNFLLQTLFTSENESLLMLRPLWISLGLLGKYLHLSPLVTYHLGRGLLLFPLLFVVYFFIKVYFENYKKARVIFLLTCFSTGIGVWVAPIITLVNKNFATALNWPIDMWVPEGFIFLSSLHSSHYLYSWILLILIYLIWLKIVANNYTANKFACLGALAGVLGILLFITHPFHILPVYLIIGIHYLFIFFRDPQKAKQIFNWLMIFGSLSFVGVFYHLFYLSNDWLTVVKALQNSTPTPNFWMVLTGYFLILPIALWQGIKNLKNYRQLDDKWLFLFFWAVVNFFLIYSPALWQRRMIQGLQIPLLLLASQWFFDFLSKSDKGSIYKYKIKTAVIVLFFMFSTSIYNIASDAVNYHVGYWLYYYSDDFYQGLTNLEKLTNYDSRILSLATTGNFIAGVSGRKVFCSHGVETAFYSAKVNMTQFFFQDNRNDDKKYQLLKNYYITHLFYSKYEKNMGTFKPHEKKYLKLTYQNPEVEIYEVIYN